MLNHLYEACGTSRNLQCRFHFTIFVNPVRCSGHIALVDLQGPRARHQTHLRSAPLQHYKHKCSIIHVRSYDSPLYRFPALDFVIVIQ